jgi:hypothetical protein
VEEPNLSAFPRDRKAATVKTTGIMWTSQLVKEKTALTKSVVSLGQQIQD